MKYIIIFKPVNTLFKLLIHTFLSWAIGFISGVLISWLFNVILDTAKNYPNTNHFGINLIAPIALVIIACITIWQNVQDVIEFVDEIKSFGFHFF